MGDVKQKIEAGRNAARPFVPRLRNNAGFSFLELLAAMAVILILLALEIPTLLRARAAADDAAAAASVRAIQAAEMTYSVTYGKGFSQTLSALGSQPGQPASPMASGLIDELLASGAKNGFMYTYIPQPDANGKISNFTIVAAPTNPCVSGLTYYTSGAYSGPAPIAQQPVEGPPPISSMIGDVTAGTGGCGGE